MKSGFVAIIGRPNVGKSSLVNALLNEERVIVSNISGTTRDSIDTPFTKDNKNIFLVLTKIDLISKEELLQSLKDNFKGHEITGFGGTLKNIGMGCGSRAGKMDMHSAGKPHVKQEKCVGCGQCVNICAHDAPTIADRKASIDTAKCVGCGRCIGVCIKDAIIPDFDQAFDIVNRKIAEYTKAVVWGRPCFHISLVIDVSPFCDCHAENDVAIVPNVGIFASYDPVALDQACVDAVNAQPAIADSLLEKHGHKHHDHFTDVSPNTDWRSCLEHAVKLGLGTREYDLIKV